MSRPRVLAMFGGEARPERCDPARVGGDSSRSCGPDTLSRMQMRDAARLVRSGIDLRVNPSGYRNRSAMLKAISIALDRGPGPEWDFATLEISHTFTLDRQVRNGPRR